MSHTSPTSLSKGELHNMYKEPEGQQAKRTLTLQFLSLSTPQGGRKMIKLSDGCLSILAAPYKTMAEKLETMELKPNAVIEGEVIYHKKQLFILLNYKVIYADLPATIGNPINYEDFTTNNYTNPSASAEIPADVVKAAGGNASATNGSSSGQKNGNGSLAPAKKAIKIDDSNMYTPLALIDTNSKSWVARVRCTNKSERRTYKNANGDGCFFSVVFQDDSKKVLQSTFFNATCDKYYDFLVDGNVYSISQLTVQRASRYNKTNNDIEVIANKATQITQLEDTGAIPLEKYNFVKVGELAAKSVNINVDIIAVVDKIADPENITLKTGEQKKKTSLFLMDDSEFTVKVDIWGDNDTLSSL